MKMKIHLLEVGRDKVSKTIVSDSANPFEVALDEVRDHLLTGPSVDLEPCKDDPYKFSVLSGSLRMGTVYFQSENHRVH